MEIAIKRWTVILLVAAVGLQISLFGQSGPSPQIPPVKLIFDTDIGNDIDDALALATLHALESRGKCELLAVTVTQRDELAGPFVDAINTFYGRPEIPIGCAKPITNGEPSKYLPLVNALDNGVLRYPHALKRGVGRGRRGDGVAADAGVAAGSFGGDRASGIFLGRRGIAGQRGG